MGNLAGKLKELFSGNKSLELCLVGLENSGKTTITDIITSGMVVPTMPTVGLNVKSVKKEGVMMKVWDLGGQEKFRAEWSRYTHGCDVIVFVVDSSDMTHVPLAKRELHALLKDSDLNGLPLLVVVNKIDLNPHLGKEEIIKEMDLESVTKNQWMVVEVSAILKKNMGEVLDWLAKHAKK